jgi:alpha-ketoglutarate-dependent taurine dioxygenase
MFDDRHVFSYQVLMKRVGCKPKLGSWIRDHLNAYGFLILQDVEINNDIESSKQFLVEICSSIGILIPHNFGKKDFVWEIKSKPSNSSLKTFSEHNEQAPLHTDSQYRNHPERYVALLTLHQATCGGGHTELVDFREILQDLAKTASGDKVIQFMTHERFPIAIPTIFQEHLRSQYISQPLISKNPLIRYRYDTLKAGLSFLEMNRVKPYQENLDYLDDFIQSSSHCFRFLSLPNEIVFIDNHRFLHGRSLFTDLDRLLLRIRMN